MYVNIVSIFGIAIDGIRDDMRFADFPACASQGITTGITSVIDKVQQFLVCGYVLMNFQGLFQLKLKHPLPVHVFRCISKRSSDIYMSRTRTLVSGWDLSGNIS